MPEHYIDKPSGLKTASRPMKTDKLKQLPGGEVVKDEKIPVPEKTADAPAPVQIRAVQGRDIDLQAGTAKIPHWHFSVQHGVTPDDLLRPEFWAGCTNKLRRREGDSLVEVTVTAVDGSFYAEMLVIDLGANWAKLKFKYPPVILDATPKADLNYHGYTIEFAAGSWRVMRDEDHAEIRNGFATAQSAFSWLEEHVRQMAA